jgi:hypothetical protein
MGPARTLGTLLPQRTLPALAVLALLAAGPAFASNDVFGSLANFDVVNNTGKKAHGFEIEIEDALYDHAGTISSVFGLDRVFWMSPDPGYVVRFGKPKLEYIPNFGARITYGGFGGAEFTPSAPYTTNGESCWPGANASWKNYSCDHFGVSTYGSPAKTSYRWLLEDGSTQVVGVPAIQIDFVSPAPGLPEAPVMRLPAQDLQLDADPVVNNQNNAFWVKIIKTELEENVDLNDLLGGDHPGARPEIVALDAKTEVEWQPLQIGMVDEVSKSVDSPKPSVVYKFQFFSYLGQYDDEGYVDPMSAADGEDQFPTLDDNGQAYVTIGDERKYLDFVGQQIAGFNANEVAAVPEPATWLLMLGGVGGLAAWRRRRA